MSNDLAVWKAEVVDRVHVPFTLAGRSRFGFIENVSDEDPDATRRQEVGLVLRFGASGGSVSG
jgi:hypothetical protein